ncbi:hypothetical protein CALCODRAFT_63694 [Calocera cornea HHB12733]|uniref:Nab2 type CCCH zinc finger 4 domain-containing protein n=1 Tax=Calocera cornea HHB12733 TaxID=1353952 RepID=A0A165DLE3_9BASI|nr:hypothetical protein CALCODRAFT_63694 [Calocera cornea HHB12733]
MAVAITMNSAEQAALQETVKKDMIERGWQAEDDPPTLSEYAVIMLINGKPEDQVDSELSEIIPDYDFGFSKWLFAEAERIASGVAAPAPAAAAAAPVAPASPVHRPLSPPQSPPRTSPNGSALKRQRSSSPSEANKVARTGDVPLAPRAMRDRPLRGRGRGERSLLERMGPRVRQQNDEIQARIDAITGTNGPIPLQQQPQNWQGSMGGNMPMGNMPVGNDMATLEMQKQWQDMMAIQMAMMQQMAMMNGGMPFGPGMMGPNGQGNQGRNDIQRGRGRGRGRGAHSQGLMRNEVADITPAAPAPAPAPVPQAAPAPKPTPAPVTPAIVTTIPGTLCKFGLKCSNPTCSYAHPSPAATVETGLVLSDELCAEGKDCNNADCTKVHPSPAKAESKTIAPVAAASQGIMCRFGANCTRSDCVFTHPWNKAAQSNTPCRYGLACTRADCVFSHPPGRSLPSAFHKGLDTSATTTTTPSKLNVAAAPFVSKNISQTFNNGSASPAVPSAIDAVAGAGQATVAEAAGTAAATLENAVAATKETIAKVEAAA